MTEFKIDTSLINDDPLDRVDKKMKAKVLNKKPFIDTHTHLFNHNDVPSGFLGIRLPIGRRLLGVMATILHRIRGNTNRDSMSKYAYFLTTMKTRSSEGIYRRMNKVYYHENHPDAVFGVLTMDMEYGIKGYANRSIWTQLATISMVRNIYPTKILPFACIDPRRKDALKLFQTAFDSSKPYQYMGLKIYPSLGYLPSHPNLMKMLEVCEQKNIPVLTHCSSGSTHGSNRYNEAVPGIFVEDDYSYAENKKFKARYCKTKKDYRDFFNRPHNWKPVLEQFPKLNLNIAHFGGDVAWRDFINGKDPSWVKTILQFIHDYDNVYSDFSYTLYQDEFSRKLKSLMEEDSKLKERVLFGSDYYMLIIEDDYKKIFDDFKSIMGKELMEQIAIENPNRHLFGI